MRDPTLNGETNLHTGTPNAANGNTVPERDHDAFDTDNGLKNRPKSAAGLHGTYDELYRLQNGISEMHVDIENQIGPRLRQGRPPALQRARSDFGPRQRSERVNKIAEEDLLHMRHGWHDEYTSNEYLSLLNSVRDSKGFQDVYLIHSRLSICTILTNGMTPVEYPNQAQKHGPTQIGE